MHLIGKCVFGMSASFAVVGKLYYLLVRVSLRRNIVDLAIMLTVLKKIRI